MALFSSRAKEYFQVGMTGTSSPPAGIIAGGWVMSACRARERFEAPPQKLPGQPDQQPTADGQHVPTESLLVIERIVVAQADRRNEIQPAQPEEGRHELHQEYPPDDEAHAGPAHRERQADQERHGQVLGRGH